EFLGLHGGQPPDHSLRGFKWWSPEMLVVQSPVGDALAIHSSEASASQLAILGVDWELACPYIPRSRWPRLSWGCGHASTSCRLIGSAGPLTRSRSSGPGTGCRRGGT